MIGKRSRSREKIQQRLADSARRPRGPHGREHRPPMLMACGYDREQPLHDATSLGTFGAKTHLPPQYHRANGALGHIHPKVPGRLDSFHAAEGPARIPMAEQVGTQYLYPASNRQSRDRSGGGGGEGP